MLGIPTEWLELMKQSLVTQRALLQKYPLLNFQCCLSHLSLGQKPFKKSLRGSDALSETSSVSHIEDLEKMEHLSSGQEQEALEANSPEPQPGAPAPQEAEQTGTFQNIARGPEDDRPQVEEPENLR